MAKTIYVTSIQVDAAKTLLRLAKDLGITDLDTAAYEKIANAPVATPAELTDAHVHDVALKDQLDDALRRIAELEARIA